MNFIGLRRLKLGLRPLLSVGCFAAVCCGVSWGSLGSSVASISTDQARMKGSIRISQAAGYSVHEIQSPMGTSVREYVSPDGKVFGVAWNGPAHPDLQQLLGPYFDTYVQAAKKRTAHGARRIQVPGLVVELSGHQRAFLGRAYVPEMVPTNVRTETIK